MPKYFERDELSIKTSFASKEQIKLIVTIINLNHNILKKHSQFASKNQNMLKKKKKKITLSS